MLVVMIGLSDHWKAVIPGTGMHDLQEVYKKFDLSAPGGLIAMQIVWEPLCSREGFW